ncbi:MAG TPA: cytochrome c maturation protein CcmE [Candidatus Limnocylindrales bacterium]|nr:cytochrome c maturation protein CcmE [Candidatus Limnocylindrales bacterium]
MNTKAKFGVGVGIIVVTLVTLGWVGARESKTYYHTISELSTMKQGELRQRMRVSGYVAQGTIQHLPGRVDFVLIEENRKLPVSYTGTAPLPDTFKDDAQALVEGRLGSDGKFTAEQVQAKCASKYEIAPTPATK